MTEWTVLGMPVITDATDDLTQPISAAAVVKGFDSNGKVAYWMATTEDLTSVEALGMYTWAAMVSASGSDDD